MRCDRRLGRRLSGLVHAASGARERATARSARLRAARSCLTSGAVTFSPSRQIDREVTTKGVDGLAIDAAAEKVSVGCPPEQLVLQLSHLFATEGAQT